MCFGLDVGCGYTRWGKGGEGWYGVVKGGVRWCSCSENEFKYRRAGNVGFLGILGLYKISGLKGIGSN